MTSISRRRRPPTQVPGEAVSGDISDAPRNKAPRGVPAGRPQLLSFDQMPEWFRQESNRWVLNGYRPISGSARASLYSWTYTHNESVNIYSHLVPAIFFLLGGCYLQQCFASRYPGASGADLMAVSIFMLSATICLSLSATYHTLMNHSQHMERFCLRLDMLGVVVFILGDLVLGIHTIFWCEPWPRFIYWGLIGISGTATIIMTMHPTFQGSKYRLARALMFVATGSSGIAPLIHGLHVFGTSQMMKKALPHTLAKAGCLLSGTLFYATRFPESRCPGRFDLWGSHSIFHVLVVCAAVIQLIGYLDALDHAHLHLVCPSP